MADTPDRERAGNGQVLVINPVANDLIGNEAWVDNEELIGEDLDDDDRFADNHVKDNERVDGDPVDGEDYVGDDWVDDEEPAGDGRVLVDNLADDDQRQAEARQTRGQHGGET